MYTQKLKLFCIKIHVASNRSGVYDLNKIAKSYKDPSHWCCEIWKQEMI